MFELGSNTRGFARFRQSLAPARRARVSAVCVTRRCRFSFRENLNRLDEHDFRIRERGISFRNLFNPIDCELLERQGYLAQMPPANPHFMGAERQV